MMLPHDCFLKYSGKSEWLDERTSPLVECFSSAERAEFGRLRDENRRQQWLAGRYIGKKLIGENVGTSLDRVQILSRDASERSVRPRILVDARQLDWSLSISHSESGALAALTKNVDLSVGVDLVRDVPCNRAFHELWFTALERHWLQQDAEGRAALLWGLKEAVYKAVNSGEGWMPQAIEILPQADASFQCLYRGTSIDLHARIWTVEDQLAVFVCIPRADLTCDRQDVRHTTSWVSNNSTLASNGEAIASCS